MRQHDFIEVLDVLACDLNARPQSAPTIDNIANYLRHIIRDSDVLVVEFDPAGQHDVAAFVAAESLCCSTMAWELTEDDPLVLRVRGTQSQLDVLAAVLALPANAE